MRDVEHFDRAHRTDHCRRATHVVLHLAHGGGGLDRDASRIKGDALADQADHRLLCLFAASFGPGLRTGVVIHHDQARWVAAALADPQNTAHLAPLELGDFHDLGPQADLARHLGGRVCEHYRGHRVAGAVG